LKHLILLSILCSFLSCKEADSPPYVSKKDYGESLHEFGRPALWDAQHKDIGTTGFIAGAGAGYYQDENDKIPDYYSIDIQYKGKDSYPVYFSRDFKIEDLPEKFIDKKIDDIVSYDLKTRIVTFKVGKETYKYTLPE